MNGSLQTTHKIILGDAADMACLAPEGIPLVVTSPPYPMISMWDESFSNKSGRVRLALKNQDGNQAFEAMHEILDSIWAEVVRVLCPGGLVCINIGDAVRSMDGRFQLYSNHARVLNFFLAHGFCALPAVLWRKQTNAPNKFMGSGMLPPGAYVTLEHEYILILRKDGKRDFSGKRERELRAESAFFWEERNQWFSDVWDIKGVRQNFSRSLTRGRSAAFPFELAFRLINMFSIQGDTVLDPFLGTGTTTRAAMASARNSAGFELDGSLKACYDFEGDQMELNALVCDRLRRHNEFVAQCATAPKYRNKYHGFPVKTRQETALKLWSISRIMRLEDGFFKVDHETAAGHTPNSLPGSAS